MSLIHLSRLSEADILHATSIDAVCIEDVPATDDQFIEVYRSLRVEDTRRMPGESYPQGIHFLVQLPSRGDLPKLQSRISQVVGHDIVAVEKYEFANDGLDARLIASTNTIRR